MDDLLQTALLGTAKQPAPPADHPADAAVAQLAVENPEQSFLLRAGAQAVYHLAGYVPAHNEAPTAAPTDSRPRCSSGVAAILAKLFTFEPRVVLVEALGRLDRAGQRLTPELLPRALSEREDKVRSALRPVLGDRGRWLCQFNEIWQWGSNSLARGGEAANLPANAEDIWKEGTFAERLAILGQVGRVDPARARQWVRDTWSHDKADHRADFLEKLVMTAGVDEADEEFLEQALGDRSANVRSSAAYCLASLFGSALARRMRARAEDMLSYTPPQTRAGSEPRVGVLTVTLPRRLPDDWKRDGIHERVPSGIKANPRLWWLSQVLTFIPTSHWETAFNTSPEELTAAAAASEDGVAVLQAWTHAALDWDVRNWHPALWDFWYQYKSPQNLGIIFWSPEKALTKLIIRMPPVEAEARVLRVLKDLPATGKTLRPLILDAFPAPWSVTVGRKYLDALRAYFAELTRNPKAVEDDWSRTLVRAAIALPEECFKEALGDLGFPYPKDVDRKNQPYWQYVVASALDQFREILLIRKELIEQLNTAPQ